MMNNWTNESYYSEEINKNSVYLCSALKERKVIMTGVGCRTGLLCMMWMKGALWMLPGVEL